MIYTRNDLTFNFRHFERARYYVAVAITTKKFHILSIRTNSIMETVVCIVLGACLCGQFTALF